MIEDKKILVLSIPAWNSRVGSDTWSTLVSEFNPDNVANICLRDENPDSLACNNYFVVSENKVIKSIFNRSIKTGRCVERSVSTNNVSEDLIRHNLRYKKLGKKRGFFGLLAREMVWKFGRWKTKELDSFIEEFNPDVIIYAMEGYIHFNRICRYVKNKTNAKSIGFFWDDNFTYKQTNRFGLKLFRMFQRRSLKKLAKHTNAFWAITDMTKKEADAFFNVDCTVVTKPLKKEVIYHDWQVSSPIKVLYTGNLQIGRDKSLLKVVKALKQINKEKTFFQIDIYTKTILKEEIKKQLDCDFCTIHTPVPQSEVLRIQEQADILLFLEDVDGPYANTARLSFSTKITDYLSSGRSIFAVGCMDTAPMQYFLENQAAIIATTESQIEERFRDILSNQVILAEYAKKACECGLEKHKKENILKIVRQAIDNLL